MGNVVPSTLKLAGSINGQEVLILVDGCSTNNFIQSCIISHLKLVVKPSSHRHVTIGNGEAHTCESECSGSSLKVGDAIFTVDVILLPIYSADYILGVQWLLQLGPVVFDDGNLWMEFDFLGTRVRLHSLTQPRSQLARPASLRKMDSNGAHLFHL